MNPATITHPDLAILLSSAAVRENIPVTTMNLVVDDEWVWMAVTSRPQMTPDDARRYATALGLTGVHYVECDQGDDPPLASIQGRVDGMRVQINCQPEHIDMCLPGEAA